MNNGMRTVIYPVGDIAKAKALFGKLLGAEPYVDQAYYVGFRVGDQEVGLDPNAVTIINTDVPGKYAALMGRRTPVSPWGRSFCNSASSDS